MGVGGQSDEATLFRRSSPNTRRQFSVNLNEQSMQQIAGNFSDSSHDLLGEQPGDDRTISVPKRPRGRVLDADPSLR